MDTHEIIPVPPMLQYIPGFSTPPQQGGMGHQGVIGDFEPELQLDHESPTIWTELYAVWSHNVCSLGTLYRK